MLKGELKNCKIESQKKKSIKRVINVVKRHKKLFSGKNWEFTIAYKFVILIKSWNKKMKEGRSKKKKKKI